jgi:hypothetical protein
MSFRVRRVAIGVCGVVLLIGWSARAQPAAREGGRERSAGASSRERQFKTMLTGKVLRGTWQMCGEEGLKGKAPLSPPRPERYEIERVSKASDDYWVLTARIQYADRDARIPVTVRVVWAEDVAIITLDERALPGLGTYSARVMVHRGFYSGTWFGKNYGGVLSGQSIDAADEPAAAASAPTAQGE